MPWSRHKNLALSCHFFIESASSLLSVIINQHNDLASRSHWLGYIDFFWTVFQSRSSTAALATGLPGDPGDFKESCHQIVFWSFNVLNPTPASASAKDLRKVQYSINTIRNIFLTELDLGRSQTYTSSNNRKSFRHYLHYILFIVNDHLFYG